MRAGLRCAVAMVLIAACPAGCKRSSTGGAPCSHATTLRLATTTSLENSGLLAALVSAFERHSGIRVQVLAMGTGKALQTARNGDCDLVFVHAPPAEEAFVAEGHARRRRTVMYNRFVILGPASDPAVVAGVHDVPEAMRRIARSQSSFCSRGDASGTHNKELELWRRAGIAPQGPWYLQAGQGMGETLIMADQKQAYVLVDESTFLAFQGRIALKALVEDSPLLLNPYSLIELDPARHPHAAHEAARQFADFVCGPAGHRLIGEFRLAGVRVFALWPPPMPAGGE